MTTGLEGQRVAKEPVQEDESTKSLSLMGGVSQQDDEETDDFEGSEPSDSVLFSQSTLLLLFGVAVAVGGLYLMRLAQGGLGLSKLPAEVEATIETALVRHAGGAGQDGVQANLAHLLDDTDSVIAMFSTDTSERQVPIEFVKKNPFELSAPPPEPKAQVEAKSVGQKPPVDPLKVLSEEAAELRLQTVMSGRVPVAMINGQFLKIGQTVGSFTISKIGSRTVELTSQGATFVLIMDQ